MSDYKTRFREKWGKALLEEDIKSFLAFIDEVVAEVREEVVEERNAELYDIQQQELEDLAEAREQGRAEERDSIIKIVEGMDEQNVVTQAILGALEYRGFYDAGKYLDGDIWERVKPIFLAALHLPETEDAAHQTYETMGYQDFQEDGFQQADKTLKYGEVGSFQEETKCCEKCLYTRSCYGRRLPDTCADSNCLCHKPRTEETPGHLVPLSSGIPEAKFIPHSKETEKEGEMVPIERGKQYSRVLIEETYDKKGNLLKVAANGVEVLSEKEGASFSGRECPLICARDGYKRCPYYNPDCPMCFARPKETTTPQVLSERESERREKTTRALKHLKEETGTPQSREQSTGGECITYRIRPTDKTCTIENCPKHGEKTNQ